MKRYASIDIGGTAVKYGIIREDGVIEERLETATEAFRGGAFILRRVQELTEQLQQQTPLSGICISTAGMVDPEAGMITYAGPQIPDYAGTQFRQVLEAHFDLPVAVENDVNCAGLAESLSGAARGCSSVLCLTIGTGIGGCVVLNGEVFHGFNNSACEIGYMHLPGGSFQDQGAASVLSAKVAGRKQEPKSQWSGRRIFREAAAGDAVCRQAIDEMTDILGMGIANICYVLNPQMVVLGGGIMAQKAYLYPRIRAAMDRYLVPQLARHTQLAMAAHGNDAGMLGAFYHFRHRYPDTAR